MKYYFKYVYQPNLTCSMMGLLAPDWSSIKHEQNADDLRRNLIYLLVENKETSSSFTEDEF